MTAAELQAETFKAVLAVELLANSRVPHNAGFGDGHKTVGVNYSLKACTLAAKITGHDLTLCKMLNHRFRTDAAELMFQRALAEASQ